MTDTISSLFEAIQSYFLDREQELLANITFEVEALQETTSCTLRMTLFFTLLSIVFFNPYTLGLSSVMAAIAAVFGYVCYTAYGTGKKQTGYPHFEVTHMIGLLFMLPFMFIIAYICGAAAYCGVELLGEVVFGHQ
jgi:hypothetical protein